MIEFSPCEIVVNGSMLGPARQGLAWRRGHLVAPQPGLGYLTGQCRVRLERRGAERNNPDVRLPWNALIQRTPAVDARLEALGRLTGFDDARL